MGRKIVLLSDGTGNSAAKVWRTNVWRTFEALDLSGSDQVAFYDDGVGTSSFRPLAILGGVFGFGLKRNVIALYKFACRNYRNADDEIFGFGFSRGAFTIRIVIGLLLSEGIVRTDNESDLQRAAVDAYRAYRRKCSHTRWFFRPEDWFRNARDVFIYAWRRIFGSTLHPAASATSEFKIRFVGVWDTVSAYGLPIDEMTRGVSQWILPLALPNHGFDKNRIARGCQALALDEERTTFHPELWDESFQTLANEPVERDRRITDQQVSQVWFAGVHSNIGGGYPDDSLAYIPFIWMITEAKKCGLRFKSDFSDLLPNPPPPGSVFSDPDTFKYFRPRADKDGRLYDPRKGLGGYYRYGPRKLVDICTPRLRKKEDDEIIVHRPKIHETVFNRIANNAHAYAPIGLPAIYDVVTFDGEVLTPDQFWLRDKSHGESIDDAADRAIAQEHVWNEVWKRRVAYFATLLATFWLLGFPFLFDPENNAETYSAIRWVSDIIRGIGKYTPGLSFAAKWIDGYAKMPVGFLTALGFVVLGLTAGSYYASRIRDMMGALWRRHHDRPHGEPRNWIYNLRSRPGYQAALFWIKRSGAPTAFAILFVALGLMAINKTAFTIYDNAGLTCNEAKHETLMAVGPKTAVVRDFDIANPCQSTGIKLEGNGARYRVTILFGKEPQDQWRDASIAMPPGGFTASKPDPDFLPPESLAGPNHLVEAASWTYRLRMFLGVPLRRLYGEDWFRILLRVGSTGSDQYPYRPDVHDRIIQWPIAPRREGELFIYVNDAVLGIPGLYGPFYGNNFGKGRLCIVRLPTEGDNWKCPP